VILEGVHADPRALRLLLLLPLPLLLLLLLLLSRNVELPQA